MSDEPTGHPNTDTDPQAADRRTGTDPPTPTQIPPKRTVFGRPFEKGKPSANPGGRPRQTSEQLFAALVAAGDAVAADKRQTDAEKLAATLGLLRGAQGLLRRVLRELRERPGPAPARAARAEGGEARELSCAQLSTPVGDPP